MPSRAKKNLDNVGADGIYLSNSYTSGHVNDFNLSVQFTEMERKCLEIDSPEELAKSKYDLPIEFHPKLYRAWHEKEFEIDSRRTVNTIKRKSFEQYILSQKTSIMYLCTSQKPERHSKFENLNAMALLNALESRPSFAGIRQIGLQLLRSSTLNMLKLIADNERCPGLPAQLTRTLFSWSAADYLRRRRTATTTWLDVYEREYKNCLETMKFKTDLQELRYYLDLIFCGALSEDKDYSFESGVLQSLEDASDLLSAYDRLKEELEENLECVRELREEYEKLKYQTELLQKKQRATTMENLYCINLTNPIQYRYEVGWYNCQTDQVAIKSQITLSQMEKELEEREIRTKQEEIAIRNTANVYYGYIEHYKMRVNQMNNKLERDLDDISNEIAFKRLSLEKIEQQRKHCEEEMQMMREMGEEIKHKMMLEEKREALKVASTEAQKKPKTHKQKSKKH